MPALPITNGFYISPSLPLSAQECLNWYPNISETAALSQENLFGTPGIVQLVTSGTIQNQNRGMHEMSGVEVSVDSDSYEAAASLGWKPKDQEPVVEAKKRGRPAKSGV